MASDTVTSGASAAVPLLDDSLLAQIITFIGEWFDSLTVQVGQVVHALANLGYALTWLRTAFADEATRSATLETTALLLGVLLVAGVAEAIAHRLLRRPRKLLQEHARLQHERLRAQEAEDAATVSAALQAHQQMSAAAAAASTQTTASDSTAHLGAHPSSQQALPPDNLPSPAELPVTEAPVSVARIQAGMEVPEPEPAPLARELEMLLAARRQSIAHSWLLQRMPYALADALLVLLPLAAFLGAMALLTHGIGPRNPFVARLAVPIVEAYALLRLGLAFVRLLISPASPQMRLLEMTDSQARYVFRWIAAAFVVTAFGVTTGRILLLVGAGREAATLCMKLTSLAVHVILIYLVVRTRHAMQAFLRGSNATGASSFRSFLAEIWPAGAVFFLAAFWVVWALSVADGFTRALRFGMITAAVLIGARLVWICVIGLLDRSFERSDSAASALDAGEYHRYHTVLRTLLSWLIYVLTAVVLLEAWGFRALHWFESGTIGRRLLSAVATVAFAALIALLVWEGVSNALKRRIRRWTEQGDTVRAARLRTLVPMIRTVLFFVIVLVVLMTALYELGINVMPLLAGASIIGIAVGFGSQKLVQDFITGIFLLMENAMQVGDYVTVAGVSGVVEYLSIRTVHLRAPDGSLHVVPFSSVSTVNNVNRGIGNARIRLNVGINADIEQVYAGLRQVSTELRRDPKFGPLILADIDIWGVDQIDATMITITGQIQTTDKGRWPVQREFNLRVLEHFRQRGIPLINPKETPPNTSGGAPIIVAGPDHA